LGQKRFREHGDPIENVLVTALAFGRDPVAVKHAIVLIEDHAFDLRSTEIDPDAAHDSCEHIERRTPPATQRRRCWRTTVGPRRRRRGFPPLPVAAGSRSYIPPGDPSSRQPPTLAI